MRWLCLVEVQPSLRLYIHCSEKMKLTQAHKSLIVICSAIALCYLKLPSVYLIIAAGIVLVFGLAIKPFREILHKAWTGLAKIMGWFMQPIILGTLFFLVVTPIALLQRLFSKSSLVLNNKSQTTFKNINKTFQAKHFENPW